MIKPFPLANIKLLSTALVTFQLKIRAFNTPILSTFTIILVGKFAHQEYYKIIGILCQSLLAHCSSLTIKYMIITKYIALSRSHSASTSRSSPRHGPVHYLQNMVPRIVNKALTIYGCT